MRENKDLGACSRRTYTISDDSTKGTKPILKNKSDQKGRLKGGVRGSNPGHSEPQSDALPTELKPPFRFRFLEIECKSTTFF